MNQQTFDLRPVCPECHKVKPEDPENLHDTVDLRWDWRKADREKLEDKIGESPMCLECFNRIQEEWGPKAPWWDEDGKKHSAEEPNPKRIENQKFYERQNDEIQETEDARRLRALRERGPVTPSGETLSRYRLLTLPRSTVDKRRRQRNG